VITVEAQARELENFRRNIVCERCSKGTASAHGIIASSSKTTPSLFSRPFLQFKKPTTSHTSPTVDLTQEPATRQHTILIKRLLSVITPTRPSNNTTSKSSVTHPTAVNPDSGPEERKWSITFNNEVEKELDVGIEHDLYHEDSIWCAKFSQDGKYLAAGCRNGKAYIYEVQTGTLTS
jgi:WD40 repeat protein